jgi:putative ATPase
MAIQALSTMILSDDAEYQDSGTASTAITEQGNIVNRLLSAKLTVDGIKSAFQKTHLQYDRQGDEHYNLISALHKSVRGGYVGCLNGKWTMDLTVLINETYQGCYFTH